MENNNYIPVESLVVGNYYIEELIEEPEFEPGDRFCKALLVEKTDKDMIVYLCDHWELNEKGRAFITDPVKFKAWQDDNENYNHETQFENYGFWDEGLVEHVITKEGKIVNDYVGEIKFLDINTKYKG